MKKYLIWLLTITLIFSVAIISAQYKDKPSQIVDCSVSVKVNKEDLLVNINTADVTELSSLPRIGEKIAVRIIDYRQSHPFEKIEDIMNVKGIGEKIFEQIKNKIKVK